MSPRLRYTLGVVPLLTVLLAIARPAAAAPEAHILRIDPRAGINGGKPLLTTVIELGEVKRTSDLLAPCATATGASQIKCFSEQYEKPGALWTPMQFPDANARLVVKVDGSDTLTRFVDKVAWGKAQNQPNVGTAWLVAVDASKGMGDARFGDARAVAHEFIEAMQPNDLMDLMFFDDVTVISDTKWQAYKNRASLANALNAIKSPSTRSSDRALFKLMKTMTQDAFGSLGNTGQSDPVPMHQAMVFLSDGVCRGDPECASPSADVFHQYTDTGRFPPENTALPKTPLPVISVYFPTAASFTENLYRNNEAQFMQDLSNPEIGGYFDIVSEGQGDAKSKTIAARVRDRFNSMWIVHWGLDCINRSVEQTFNLYFENTNPTVAPDGTFKDVPLGIDYTQWPLDIDVDKTVKAAQDNPLYPGGQFTVYGNFCWSGDKTRAEAYFVPAGTQPSPQTNSHDPAQAKAAMQQLQAEGMKGDAVSAGDTYVTLTVPDNDKVLEGTGDATVARAVVYDNKAMRASAIDAKSVLTLKASKKPFSWPLVAGVGGLVVVIILLVLVLLRGGGNKRKGGGAPPAPVGPGYGPPPGGGPPYGAPPPGGGYGMQGLQPEPALATGPVAPLGGGFAPGPVPQVQPQPLFAMGAQAPPTPPPMMAQDPRFAGASAQDPRFAGASAPDAIGSSAPPAVQVRCPACGMNTMATPGLQSVCFSCGQPLPADVAKGGGGVAAPGFPLTSAMNAQPLVPPPSPYGPPGGIAARAATIRGTAGQFTIRPGSEVRVGRDPAQCPVFLSEPRVSGVHATLRFDGGQLLVRDETSNNGTWIGGARIAPGTWTPVPMGTALRFGPIEFSVQADV
jgi:hypothetical protein